MDSGRKSKDTELEVLTKFNQALEIEKLNAKEKIKIYSAIRKLRKEHRLKPGDYDALGYNLLHWATQCNQVDEVNELVNKFEWSDGDNQQGADMDAITLESRNLIRNITPLWIAAKNGYTSIVRLLLKNQADLLIPSEEYIESFFGGAWYQKSTPLFEAYIQKQHETVKLLEQPTLEAYDKLRRQQPEYKTTTSVLGLFNKDWGYSKTDKLKAAQALQQQLSTKECSQESLEALEKIHPAVNTGELGAIYQASLGIRKRL